MFFHAFFMGISTTFFETAASALFLSRFTAGSIPLVYIGAAIVSTLTGVVYSRLRDRISFWNLMNTTLVFLAVTVLGFRFGLTLSAAAGLVFGLFIWYRVLSILTDLEYWAVAARLYDVRQSKRLFGFIGSGEVFARTIGAFSVPLLVTEWRVISVPDLIVVSGIALLVCIVLVIAVARGAGKDEATSKEKLATGTEHETAGSLKQIRRLLSNNYISLIFMLTTLGVLGKYFVDFAFLQQMQSRYTDVAKLAGFFGLFSGVTQVINLLLRVFVSGRVINRWGVRVGLLILPITHVVCTLAIVAVGLRGEVAMGLIFWLVIANQGIYKTMKHPFDNPSLKVLYQPLSKEERLTTQIVNEVILSPITIGIAGLIMLLFTKVIPYDPVQFALVMLVTFAAWVTMGVRSYREYSFALFRALKKRIVDTVTFTLDDAPSIEIVRSKLESTNPTDVIFCLSLLEKIEHKSLGSAIARLVDHSSPDVRRYAILGAGRHKVVEALAAIERRAAMKEESASVRGAAIYSLALIGDDARVRQAAEYLNHSSPTLRREAMVGLLYRGDPRFISVVRERLGTAVRSADAADRVFAASVIGEVRLPDLNPELLALLRDSTTDVRRAALEACAGIDDENVLRVAVQAFADPALCSSASMVIAAVGPPVVPLLESALCACDADRPTSLRIVRALGRIGGPEATAALRGSLDHPDEVVRTRVLESLSICRYRAAEADVPAIEARVRAEIAQATWKFAILGDLSAASAVELLRTALEDEVGLCRQRLFHLVSFINDADVILSARDNYFSGARERRAYAIEILDVTLPDRLRQWVLPVVEDLPLAARLERLGRFFPQEQKSERDRIAELLGGDRQATSPWTRAAAIYAIGKLPLPELHDAIRALVASNPREPLLFEAAEGLFGKVGEASYTEGAAGDSRPVYSTIERVIILKTVPMFASASEQILAEIASALEEVEFENGESIFSKGDVGNSMYVIISGTVRVHDGERTIVHLGDRDVFGELAILDPEPRSASITAAEPTSLFRLDRDSFYELMADHIEIVKGVLHVICQRLRNATAGKRPDDRPPASAAIHAPAESGDGAPTT